LPFLSHGLECFFKYDKKDIFPFCSPDRRNGYFFFLKTGHRNTRKLCIGQIRKTLLGLTSDFWYSKNIVGPSRLGLVSKFLPLRFNNLIYNAIAKNRFDFGQAYYR
jgi:hypothetical protein